MCGFENAQERDKVCLYFMDIFILPISIVNVICDSFYSKKSRSGLVWKFYLL